MTIDGTTPNVFGLPDDSEMFADFATEETPETEEAPATDTQEVEQETEGQPEEAPQESPVDPEQETETEAPVEEQPQAAEEFVFGTFKGTDAQDVLNKVEASRQNAERMATQKAQEAAAARREYEQVMQALKQNEPLLRQAAALQQQQQQPEVFDATGELDAQALQQLIDQRAQAQAQTLLEQHLGPLQQQQQAQEQARLEQEIAAFRLDHPESTGRDLEIYSVLEEYRYDPDTKQEVFAPTKDNLSVAFTLATRPEVKALVDMTDYVPDPELVAHATEAADNESLREVVEANPDYLASPKGMAFARRIAGLPPLVQKAQANATQAQSQAAEVTRRQAHVERGEEVSPGDTAPGRKAKDPLEEALFDSQTRANVFGL